MTQSTNVKENNIYKIIGKNPLNFINEKNEKRNLIETELKFYNIFDLLKKQNCVFGFVSGSQKSMQLQKKKFFYFIYKNIMLLTSVFSKYTINNLFFIYNKCTKTIKRVLLVGLLCPTFFYYCVFLGGNK